MEKVRNIIKKQMCIKKILFFGFNKYEENMTNNYFLQKT